MSTLSSDDQQKIVDIAIIYLERKATLRVKACPWVVFHESNSKLNFNATANLALHHTIVEKSAPRGLVGHYQKMLVAALLFAMQQSKTVIVNGVTVAWVTLLQQIPNWQDYRSQVLQEVRSGNTSYGIKP